MRYFIVFSYDGTKFHGFQRQKDIKNVQGTIEDTLSKVLKEDIVIKGSGRTDAGVHALGQTATFDVSRKIELEEKRLIKEALHKEIIFRRFRQVNSDFHARFSAQGKWYRYKINLGTFNNKYIGYHYQPRFKVDVNNIIKAKDVFLGTHDFHNFVSGYRDNYETTIYSIDITYENDILIIDFKGKAFYRYMIRNLVGALLDIGKSRVSISEVKEMLDNKNFDKQLATVPADGLYLMEVYY